MAHFLNKKQYQRYRCLLNHQTPKWVLVKRLFWQYLLYLKLFIYSRRPLQTIFQDLTTFFISALLLLLLLLPVSHHILPGTDSMKLVCLPYLHNLIPRYWHTQHVCTLFKILFLCSDEVLLSLLWQSWYTIIFAVTVLKYYGLCSGSAEILLSLQWQCWSTMISAMKWEEWVQITYSLKWQCLSNIVFVVALLNYYLICCSRAEILWSLLWQCWSTIVFAVAVLKYYCLCCDSAEVQSFLQWNGRSEYKSPTLCSDSA